MSKNPYAAKKRPRNEKTYTVNDARLMFKMFNDGASIDDIHAKFPDRQRKAIANKLTRMGLTRR